MTPLERIIRQEIAVNGPMRLDRYMALCLGHPQHGYYMTRDPFGSAGDFTTAPEVSQMFGELIGVWCAAVWQAIGAPAPFSLIELGPGRGTLMADALRAGAKAPGFAQAAQVCLVETSPALRRIQEQTIARPIVWFDRLEDVPEGSAILVANEFFDAVPIRQMVRQEGRWFERHIGIGGNGGLAFGLVPAAFSAIASEGAVIEFAPQRSAVAENIGRRLKSFPGAALIIDYGHVDSAAGDTFQALRKHGYSDPLQAPGEADLTAHVDFAALADALRGGGAMVRAPMSQRAFLLAMGLEQRAAVLSAREPAQTAAAVERLAGARHMGEMFKVLAATSPDLPTPYPFGPQ